MKKQVRFHLVFLAFATSLIITLVAIPFMASATASSPLPQATTPEPTGTPQLPPDAPTITLMSHDSFNISEAVLHEFELANQVRVQLLPSGDAGAALNQAILSKNNPLADLFFGVDNTFLSRALQADIFEPYDSPMLSEIRDELKLDAQNRLLPVDYGDVCLNYDKEWFAQKGITPPRNLESLIEPTYKGLTVVENPATSSPGLAFLLTTIGHFGEDKYLEYWRALRDNDVLVVDGWEEAYWGQFSAASEGNRPIVVSYASSPPAEVYFAEQPLQEAPTAAVTADESCFRQVEFVGILKGTAQRALAEKLVDYMLDKRFQEDIPLNMFMFPANVNASLPEVFVKFAQIPEQPATVPPEAIEANRERWIEEWTEVMLR
jgi:thiamine transport system substrate-binding protein